MVYIQTYRGACVRIYTDILNLKRIRITKLSAYRAQNKSLRRRSMVRHILTYDMGRNYVVHKIPKTTLWHWSTALR